MGESSSGNRDSQLASRSVLKDFTDDAVTIPAGSLFQNGTALAVARIGGGGYDISFGGT